MRLFEYLSDPAIAPIYLLSYLAGLSVVLMCGVLSVLVVVKNLSSVGQGISHSAFGGIGVAALLAALGVLPTGPLAGASWSSGLQLLIVTLFCVAAALGIAAISDRRTVSVDTAIGVFLVASMALGAIFVQLSQSLAHAHHRTPSVQSWESILFGSILAAGKQELWTGWFIAILVIATAWLLRRPLLFWAFDEDSAQAFGVRTARMKIVLMILLSLAVVVAMRLAGVILATALLVLPGATALKLSRRLWPVTTLSVLIGVLGLTLGMILSIELDWQPGPSIVVVLTALFAAAALLSGLVRRRSAPTATA